MPSARLLLVVAGDGVKRASKGEEEKKLI